MSQSMMYLWARDADRADPFSEHRRLFQIRDSPANWASAAPKPYTVYRHYKGGKYVVLGFVARREDDWLPKVAYASISDGEVWVRKISDWLDDVKMSDGRRIARFKMLEGRTNDD
jgi:hypothetical protein